MVKIKKFVNKISKLDPSVMDQIKLGSIRKQPHYNDFKIQPAKFIGENKLDFLAGNVIKYVVRFEKKNGLEDLQKARHYLDMLIERTEKGTVTP